MGFFTTIRDEKADAHPYRIRLASARVAVRQTGVVVVHRNDAAVARPEVRQIYAVAVRQIGAVVHSVVHQICAVAARRTDAVAARHGVHQIGAVAHRTGAAVVRQTDAVVARPGVHQIYVVVARQTDAVAAHPEVRQIYAAAVHRGVHQIYAAAVRQTGVVAAHRGVRQIYAVVARQSDAEVHSVARRIDAEEAHPCVDDHRCVLEVHRTDDTRGLVRWCHDHCCRDHRARGIRQQQISAAGHPDDHRAVLPGGAHAAWRPLTVSRLQVHRR